MPKILRSFFLTCCAWAICWMATCQDLPIQAGDSLFAIGDYDAAINQYELSIDNPQGIKKVARIYATMGNLDHAITNYRKALKETPEDQQTQFELGKLLLRSNQPVEAMSLFRELSFTDPVVAAYHYYLAESHDALENTKEAITEYKLAVGLQPSYRAARIALISNLIKTRQTSDAIIFAQKGLEQNPDDIKINSLLCQAYYNARLYSQSIEVFNKLFELGNDTEFNRKSLALSYLGDAEWQKAADNLKIFIDQYDDKDATIWFQLARAYYRLEMYDEAIDAMEYSILFKRPAIDQEYLQLSSIWAQKGDLKKAFNYIKLGSQEAPENETIAYQLVLAADNYFKDTATIINYYERFVSKFGADSDYGATAAARLSDLKKKQFMNPQD